MCFPKNENNYIIQKKLPKLHEKDTILNVTIPFSWNKGKQKQAVDPLLCP